ncbi:MAG: ATP-binding cassette domain-containing protein, partial [Tannerella sp.]|nr:ATP-binding cassette domain-containing protein [Tannerella sp.]
MKQFKYTINGSIYNVTVHKVENTTAEVEVNGTPYKVLMDRPAKKQVVTIKRPAQALTAPVVARPASTSAAGVVRSPLPGVILSVDCHVGDEVKKGQKLLVLEAMKMENTISAESAGKVVEIKVGKGDIYGFIGENGAGKTTLMRMVCGLAAPTGGEIALFGSNNLVSQRHRVGCTIENPALYAGMTAMENMEAQGRLLGIKEKRVYAKLLEMAGISGTGKKKAKDFSLGMKQRLMIALALLGDPEFLVLDEPTNGLDPMGIKEVRDFIGHLNQERGMTVLMSSHILGDLEKLA